MGIVVSYLADDILRVSGFGDFTTDNAEIDKKRMKYIKEIASKFYGEEAVYKGAFNEWRGMRPVTPDDNPILGQLR